MCAAPGSGTVYVSMSWCVRECSNCGSMWDEAMGTECRVQRIGTSSAHGIPGHKSFGPNHVTDKATPVRQVRCYRHRQSDGTCLLFRL